MKKYLYLLLVPLALTLACNKAEPEEEEKETEVVGQITLNTEEAIVLSDEGGSKQVSFSATKDWTAASSESWLNVEPKSGSAGDATLTLTAAANTSDDSRKANVTLTSDKSSKIIQVTQKQKGALVLVNSTIPVKAEGGTVKITAKANSNVTATIDEEAKDWITDITTKALIDYNFEFEIEANPGEEPRIGKIVFSNESCSETVTIEQEGYVPSPPESDNVTGRVTCNGEGVADVLVSDGIQIVKTDADGNYGMHSEKKWQNVFVIVPSGYEAPLDGVQPQFYKSLTEDADTPEEANFELVVSEISDFRLLVLGDMHLARRTGDLDQFAKVSRTIEDLMDTAPGKVFALTLGDHAWDMFWKSNNYNLTDYLNTMNDTFGSKEVPFFFTMGNHDNEMEKAGDVDKALSYIHTIAPTYYSFNIGHVHFIVLDDMDFTGVPEGQSHRSEYRKNFTSDQLEWLRKDLSHVDKSSLIVVSAHEPMAVPDGLGWKEELNGPDADKTMFMSIFDGYEVHMMTGHTHSIFNRELSPTFHEHNYGAVCGTWWWSGYLTPGIHIGQEGSPGGFGVFDFDDNTITNQYYQAACQSRNYQFRAYDMNKVKEFLTEDYADGHSDWTKYYNYIQGFEDNVIFMNVWDWDENWRVEVWEGDTQLEVTRVGGAYDPLHIAAFTGPRLRRSDAQGTSPSFQTRKWNHFFKATASSATSTVTVKVTDRYGNLFQEVMERPKAFSISEYKNEVDFHKPVAECVAASSSSLTFGWTVGGTAAEDASAPYHLALYKDAACTEEQLSFDVPAESSCWSGKPLRYVFGSLEPATKYYFKVTNMQNRDVSNVVEGTTEAFTVVDPSTVSDAGVGDVILAEDFSEIGWGADMLADAAGFIPSGKPLEPMSGNYTDDDGSFQKYDNTGGRIYGEARVTSDLRLFNWGFFGNSAVYSYVGYLRVGSSDSGARTHIVSPALSGIPEGKLATVDVTLTYAKYDSSGSDVAVFVNDHSSLTLALAPDQKESTNPKFSSQGGKYTGASLAKAYPLPSNTKEWSTNTVRIEGVDRNSCLLIGSSENVDKKNRFFLSDVKVQIVSLEEPVPIRVEKVTSSSSTLIFTWTEGKGASADVANAYTATLYKDSACSQVDQSFDFPEDLGAWKGKQPKYVFGGLKPSTTYWLKVKDTTNNLESNAIEATTDAFNVVNMPESITETGVVLAEDFGEIRWEFDHITTAVGFRPLDNSSFANTEVKTSENNAGSYIYDGYHYSGGGEMTFKGPTTALNNSRLADWLSDTNVYLHPGYLKLGTSSSRGWILTPEFTVPEGKKAIVKVTITAARLNTSQDSNWSVVVLTPELAKANPSAHTASFDWPDKSDQTLYQEIAFSNTDWATNSVSGLVLRNKDRISFGGTKDGTSTKGRAYISDITVEVISIEDDNDANRTTKVSVIGDSISTFKGWCDTTKGGAYYPKSDGDVSSVSDTWWYKLIYDKMSTGKFEKNISAGNTTVVQNTTGDSSAYWYGWDFGTRLQTLGIGEPDVVLIHGGTNDYGHTSWYGTSEKLIDGVAMSVSSFPDGSIDKLDELYATASDAATIADADALDGTTFCSAYIRLIQMILVRHPNAKVVCVIGDYLRGGQGEAIKLIADRFGDDKVRVADILGEGISISKYSSPHPDAAGMATMADFIYSKVGEWIDE